MSKMRNYSKSVLYQLRFQFQ